MSQTPPYTLYLVPFTASFSTHWLLVHLEQGLSISHTTQPISFPKKDQKSPTYLSNNPKGRVPTLEIDGIPYTESAALIQILCERHPEAKLCPGNQDEHRARYLELVAHAANSLLPALRDHFYASRDGDGSEAATLAIGGLADRRIDEYWGILEGVLEGKKYLLGDEISGVDFLVGGTLAWNVWVVERANAGGDNLKGWVERIMGREDWKEVVERETAIAASA